MSEPIGSSALLRVAGLPISYWLAGANPALFELARTLLRAEDRYSKLGPAAADRIGGELIPSPLLGHSARALALSVRRKLHGRLLVPGHDYERLASAVAQVLGTDSRGLLDDLAGAVDCAAEVDILRNQLHDECKQERVRLVGLPDLVAAASPLARAVLGDDHVGPRPGTDNKRTRQRAERDWWRLTRAATASTPRGWFSQVALLPVGPQLVIRPDSTLGLTSEFAAQWTESIDDQRRALAAEPLPLGAGAVHPKQSSVQGQLPLGWHEIQSPDIRLSLTPLHQTDGDLLYVVVSDPDLPDRVSELRLRRTELLSAVHSALLFGALPLPELERIVRRLVPDEERQVVIGFLAHLAKIRVLQPCATPRQWLTGWGSETKVVSYVRTTAHAVAAHGRGAEAAGWLDVYRSTRTPMAGADHDRLQRLVAQAMRVLALVSVNGIHPPTPTTRIASRPLMDVLRQRLRTGELDRRAWRRTPHWSAPAAEASGFGQLCERLAARLDHRRSPGRGAGVDIDAALLDELGAPPAAIDWPVDCLLRLPAAGSGYAGVLDQVWPAGVVDARFAQALAELHGAVPHVQAYQRFLSRLEDETGVLLVELLIPPLSARAANAVRRPAYTRAFTGDPDLATFRASGDAGARYFPLDAITVHSGPSGFWAEVDGQRIWPVYHATRSPLPPWDHVAELLLAAAPRIVPRTMHRLHHSLGLFPERTWMPRITVGGDLVVSPAQWRLSADELWEPDQPTSIAMRAAIRLRDRLGLPRFLFVTAGTRKPVPVDLESLHGLKTIGRLMCNRGTPGDHRDEIIAAEMIPDPDALGVTGWPAGEGHRLVAEVLLRLPADETPEAMAARVGHRLRGQAGLPVDGVARSPPGRLPKQSLSPNAQGGVKADGPTRSAVGRVRSRLAGAHRRARNPHA